MIPILTVSPIDIIDIVHAIYPAPGISVAIYLHVEPWYTKGTLGPATFERNIVTLRRNFF